MKGKDVYKDMQKEEVKAEADTGKGDAVNKHNEQTQKEGQTDGGQHIAGGNGGNSEAGIQYER